jgi:hypothetical protein
VEKTEEEVQQSQTPTEEIQTQNPIQQIEPIKELIREPTREPKSIAAKRKNIMNLGI